MNKIKGVFLTVSVVVMAGIASGVGTFVNDDFESGNNNGDAVTSRGAQWKSTDASVMVSNSPAATGEKPSGSLAVAIPVLQSVSNEAFLAASETNVWTDFWTIPRPFVSDVDNAPTVETNTSAMFFVTNTFWAVIYGQGGTITNVSPNDVWGINHVVANDGATWHHVSVFHNYTSGKWSLFVDERPLMTNMAFISSVSSYEWFAVQNGGGNASNVTWIDDVLITNRVPASLTKDDDNDGMYDAWELMYFGNFSDAVASADPDGDGFNNSQESVLGANPGVISPDEPGGSNVVEYVFNDPGAGIVSLEVTNASSMRLGFEVGSNRVYQVLRSANPNQSFASVGSFYTGPNKETNWWVDADALAQQNDRFFYRLMATNGAISVTNNETYVVYKQSRQTANTYYWVGIAADYGTENKLNSTLGAHLAVGLTGGETEEVCDSLTLYPGGTYYVNNGKWYTEPNGAGTEATAEIPLGSGVLIRKKGAAGGVGAIAGLVPAGSNATVTLGTSWNFICWPYTASNSVWHLDSTAGLTGDSNMANTASELWMYRGGNTVRLRLWSDNTWREWVTGRQATPADWWYYMHPGDGVFVKKIDAGDTTWAP